jgi:hypothetical protein
MLDQQERNMASEAKQLASVGEYLRLRQEKLNLVETSFTNAGPTSTDMGYSAPVRVMICHSFDAVAHSYRSCH